jgi:hypothetical protein
LSQAVVGWRHRAADDELDVGTGEAAEQSFEVGLLCSSYDPAVVFAGR